MPDQAKITLSKDRVSMTFDLFERRPTTEWQRTRSISALAFSHDGADLRLHSYQDFSYIESRLLAYLIGQEVDISIELIDSAGAKVNLAYTGFAKNVEADHVDGRPTSAFVIEPLAADV